MDSQDQNNSMCNANASTKKTSIHENIFLRGINYDITSFKTKMNQEVCFEDDDNEQYLDSLSIEDLDTKLEKYNTLYLENKINILNAFDIDLISCVRQMIKKSKQKDILEICSTFDAISKVYSCRVDDILIMGHKLIKEFVSETKNQKLVKDNEIKTKQKNRKKLMLTTADKLCRKDNQMLPNTNYISIDLGSDMIDYAKPSRIMLNKYFNETYWPEYNVSKNIKVNENQQETYEMENLSFLIEKGKICPSYHKFIAEYDKSTNCDDDTDMNKLDNIVTHFNPETSAFCANNSEDTDDSMDVDLNEPSLEKIVQTGPGSSNQNNQKFGRLDNLDSLSQILLMVDTTDSSDYTFLDRKQTCNVECPNHWKEKFEMMKIDSKQKAMRIKSRVAQTHSKTNLEVSEYQFSNLRPIKFKVDFYLDISTTLENIKLNSGKNQCSYFKWKPRNNLISSSDQSNIRPIRQLESCKFINMVPNWYKHEFEKLKLNANPKALFLFPEQDILKDSLLVDKVLVKNTDYTDKRVMDTDYSECENENDEMMIEINEDNNLTVALNQKNTPDDAYEEYTTSSSGYIDMHQLKKYIMNIIKPDGEKTINIQFADLILRLPKLLPEDMKENISVSVIYVALLHLCNEQSLCLKNENDDIFISEISVNSEKSE